MDKKKKKILSEIMSELGKKGGKSKSEKKKKGSEEMSRIAKLRWEKEKKEEAE